ncbi:hypothetical protein SISNIDRAFT_448107 [Sistotremastrum niveocremeum HHB9708]|uniref:Protein transport protein sec16 n=2 Tax=Sistotremastraceae TaxID=3402574 RepID=A0A165ALY9_9AGAM|nr:hypothetical protein SISNIDRAFT_448107 [Sistotremastrum niveocremeum HHB9708]KZT42072.1 hypothetical protein SISSUDRAFT_1041999 [Sistotremastrum suecicum HHB10207 ss-3]
MASVEAAASLFGDANDGVDFFQSISEQSAHSHPEEPPHNVSHGSEHISNGADSLFNGTSGSNYPELNIQDSHRDVQESYTHAVPHDSSHAPYDSGLSESTDYSSYGYYDEDGQWQTYQNSETYGSTGYPGNDQSASVQGQFASYDPNSYVPSGGTPQSGYSTTQASTYEPRNVSYDPYAPVQANHSTVPSYQPPLTQGTYQTNQYSPQPAFSVPQVVDAPYDPYRPAVITPKRPDIARGLGKQGTPFSSALYSEPPPPARPALQNTASYRRSDFGAYDPPIKAPAVPKRQLSAASDRFPLYNNAYIDGHDVPKERSPPPPPPPAPASRSNVYSQYSLPVSQTPSIVEYGSQPVQYAPSDGLPIEGLPDPEQLPSFTSNANFLADEFGRESLTDYPYSSQNYLEPDIAYDAVDPLGLERHDLPHVPIVSNEDSSSPVEAESNNQHTSDTTDLESTTYHSSFDCPTPHDKLLDTPPSARPSDVEEENPALSFKDNFHENPPVPDLEETLHSSSSLLGHSFHETALSVENGELEVDTFGEGTKEELYQLPEVRSHEYSDDILDEPASFLPEQPLAEDPKAFGEPAPENDFISPTFGIDTQKPAKPETTYLESQPAVEPPTIAPQGVYDPYAPPKRSLDKPPTRPIGPGHTHSRSFSQDPHPIPPAVNPYIPGPFSTTAPTVPLAVPVRSATPETYAPPRASLDEAQIYKSPVDPYHPSRNVRRQDSAPPEGGIRPIRSLYSGPPAPLTFVESLDSSDGLDVQLDQPVYAAPTYSPYAPSPSLLGSNDPLGRTSARVPVFSFGFGGKVATCFHSSQVTSTGFDVAMSSHQAKTLQIRSLNQIIPASVLESSTAVYPGPLFADQGTLSSGLVRTGATSAAKAKKAAILKYLDERAVEVEQGLGYNTSGQPGRGAAEGKLILVRILRALVSLDGKLNDNPAAEREICQALVPSLKDVSLASASEKEKGQPVFTAPLAPSLSSQSLTQSLEKPLLTYHLKSSALSQLQNFLLLGERRQALHFALDEKLWSHALLIASSLDKDAWNEAVKEFIHAELCLSEASLTGMIRTSTGANGREGLRVAYGLLAGQGPAAIQHLPLPGALVNGPMPPPMPPLTHVTPLSPNFPAPAQLANIGPETLASWPEIAASIFANSKPGDSGALTYLGDYLTAHNWIEAAHCCYLLSPSSSSLGGAGSGSARAVLLGSADPSKTPGFHKNSDPFIFTEIAEFALSLTPNKGQDPFSGLAHLQAYRLIRASQLAEVGYTSMANRYCEAIGASLRLNARGSKYYTQVFLEQLKQLSDRLTGAPQMDKSGSWISRKVAKPSLDTIGGWLEGRLTKFIAGDSDSPTAAEHNGTPQTNNQAFSGTFSAFSNISSTSTSQSPSPSPSLQGVLPLASGSVPPPRRTGSAMAVGTLVNSKAPIDRASSAMDHLRPSATRASPVPRISSASAAMTTFSQSAKTYTPFASATYETEETDSNHQEKIPETSASEPAAWWNSGSGSGGQYSSGRTPTATTFFSVNEDELAANASQTPDGQDITPQAHKSSHVETKPAGEDEEDDLGLGNSRRGTPNRKPDAQEEKPSTKEETPKKESASDSLQPSGDVKPSSSWLGWIWKRNDSEKPAPVKANLGEEVTFYYDKDLKRWINKKAGADASAPATPPPPPSRVQTASPARASASMSHLPPSTSGGSEPPRSVSAFDLSASPPKKPPMRARSNLVPGNPGDAPSTPSSPVPSPGLAPPPGRPKSSTAKRNIRSRYVDVFQQNGLP